MEVCVCVSVYIQYTDSLLLSWGCISDSTRLSVLNWLLKQGLAWKPAVKSKIYIGLELPSVLGFAEAYAVGVCWS